ncbi:MAG TPA: glycine cleavage T C-terminal barrel domain-containing protein [Acidimicrobiales bacterium]|nr:glycine cleavage T C-terminal barrel domain-containing protein [Acidimicrobiales bacterium]
MPPLADDYRALRQEAGAVWLSRDFLRVLGPDAVSWLQGQLSQDVARLAVGESADSFLLQPQGKVDALLRVTRTAHEEMVIDVDAGFGEAVAARLNRFKIRVKAEVEPLAWRCLALRGPRAKEVDLGSVEGVVVVEVSWPGLAGIDLIGPDVSVPPGVHECGPKAWDVVRIEAGIPMMGSELTEKTIPAEAGVVERAVSFTKGCFTGQELVARIDSRGGNVPRHLRGVVLTGDTVTPPPGAVLVVNGKEVGSLTSAAASPGGAGTVALAYVRREIEPPADAQVTWDGGSCGARIDALPLVP